MPNIKKVAVIGSSGAIGNSICKKLINDDSVEEVYKFSRVIKNEDTDKIKNIEIDSFRKSEKRIKKNEKNDEEAVKEILDIFPGSKIDNQE